jgi:hypothetical protein
LTYRVKRFKYYNIFTPIITKITEITEPPVTPPYNPPPPVIDPTKPPETPYLVDTYRNFQILYNADLGYYVVINGMTTAEATIAQIKVLIDDYYNSLTTPPPTELKVITVNKTIEQTTNLDGKNYLKYIRGPNLGDSPLMRVSATVQAVLFDDQNYAGVSPTVEISGSGHLQYCTLDNCEKYGFTAANADGFAITNNVINKCQYGITGASGSGNAYWAKNGVVSGNLIQGMRLTGIKAKAWENVDIHHNEIILKPVTANSVQGINFSHDAPNLNCLFHANHVYGDGTGVTYGVLTEKDLDITKPIIHTAGNQSYDNLFENLTYGHFLKGANFKIGSNAYVSVKTPITNQGSNNIIP